MPAARWFMMTWSMLLLAGPTGPAAEDTRPNILFAIADDWGRHAGAYGDPVVQTPHFDRLAREGVLFREAFVSSPSCTPSRGAILTGQWHWRLGAAANLWSEFPDSVTTYPEILAAAGYFVGVTGKGWGPGRTQTDGRPLAGQPFASFAEFLAARPPGTPFCFWLGTSDPHRPYDEGAAAASGMRLEEIALPACFPDHPVIRGDVGDYFVEVQRFDALVGSALGMLEQRGELDRTLVVMTSDHGMPFPRSKSNLYDSGTRVPLAVRWPGGGVQSARAVDDLVSLIDLAPTFLAAAGLEIPGDMTGRDLQPFLAGAAAGRIDPNRDSVLVGKERHVPAQESPDFGGYPSRGIRTHDFLFIRNFRPDRWPNGTPYYESAAAPGNWYADTDNGPTKYYMVTHRNQDATHRRLYEAAFAKRPAEELYDLARDPDQLTNVAGQPAYAEVQQNLAKRLEAELRAAGDPRLLGGGERLDQPLYLGGGPKHPAWPTE